MWAELSDGMREGVAQRWHVLRLMPRGGPVLVSLALCVQLVAGVLPVLFILVTAQLVASVPAAVVDGVDSASWDVLREHLVVTAVVFFGIQLLLPVQAHLGERVAYRVDNHVHDRLMAASFTGGGVAVLEDPEALDEIVDAVNLLRIAEFTPGAAVAGSVALVSRYVQVILAAVAGAVASAWWAGVLLLGAALVLRFGYRLGLTAFGRIYRSQARARRRRWYFRDLLTRPPAAKEIRLFGLLAWAQDSYTAATMSNARPVWQARRQIFYGPYVVYTLVACVALTATLALVAGASAAGSVTIGAFMVVTQAALSAIRIGGFIAEADTQTDLGTLSYHRVRRFEEITTAADAATRFVGAAGDPAGRPGREIQFCDVSFRYTPDGPDVLDGLDLTIRAGESLAIVGLNGAGKTTLVKLLARLYEPTGGAILVDGVDIRSFAVGAWQRQLAAIFQDFVHFELSVRDNVGFGAVDLAGDGASFDAAIWRSLDRAGVGDTVRQLPRQLDTVLSRQYEGGVDLSGGQWQRIAISRALLAVDAGARVLVLDEPTANLDVRAEAGFFEQFLALTKGVASIVISHRFSAVRRAHRIAVLESGRVVECGSHDELMAMGGRYADLFTHQADRFSDDDEPTTCEQAEGVRR
ncbi:ABC transporter ATP-binding protein [Actinoplanes sp. NPDC051346]|uniref:ABC transporter ATP-binding protein n=1 Tax=Actinoplanes sp. NPDC051346 TaxID=3155048 RepID=UPI00341650CF